MKSFGILSSNLQQGCKNCILRVRRIKLKKKKWEERTIKLSFFDNENFFSAICWQTFAGFWRSDFTCPWEHFEEKFFQGEIFDFPNLWDMEVYDKIQYGDRVTAKSTKNSKNR